MIHIKQAVVVEGRYDRKKLQQFVDAPVFETRGFGIMNDRQLLRFLRQIAQKRGLIILTDSDGAGFVIRNYLKGALPKEQVLHAYIPDIPGKERRKSHPGKEGLLGVEAMDEETIYRALLAAGAVMDEEAPATPYEPLTYTDLYHAKLTGHSGSRALRKKLSEHIGLPAHLGTAALLDALNILLNRQELFALAKSMENNSDTEEYKQDAE